MWKECGICPATFEITSSWGGLNTLLTIPYVNCYGALSKQRACGEGWYVITYSGIAKTLRFTLKWNYLDQFFFWSVLLVPDSCWRLDVLRCLQILTIIRLLSVTMSIISSAPFSCLPGLIHWFLSHTSAVSSLGQALSLLCICMAPHVLRSWTRTRAPWHYGNIVESRSSVVCNPFGHRGLPNKGQNACDLLELLFKGCYFDQVENLRIVL